jgi:1-acyl-sn-glycerol-3-phosphate acyltransferase
MKYSFDDIRPYRDDEVRGVLDRVIGDAEFVRALTRFRFPWAPAWLLILISPLIRVLVRCQTRAVQDVAGFQEVIESYMRHMIEKTTTEFSVSGLDQLDSQKHYLFISNHRDIAMDPAFVNWALYHNGMGTVRIAIGDNLLTKPYASDLMRLNKSFLVKRSETAPKKIFAALKTLSAYIAHSVNEENEHVWIAQREGRAKDGVDLTDPAIIKMIAMSRPKTVSFADYIRSLRIVPVAISYEWDPCDITKAEELDTLRQQGSYEKDTHEDVQSIARGIAGNKGHVHLSFGSVLDGEFGSAEEVADAIDAQIRNNYYLHPTNYLAADRKSQAGGKEDIEESTEIAFEHRLMACRESARDLLLDMYANPLNER